MGLELIIPILAATIQSGTPILYATLGEMLTERSGVLNLGVEGMMIFGAFFAFVISYYTGNPWLAFACAGILAGILGLAHAVVCLVFQGNQVVSGLALTILGVGLADFLGTPYVGMSAAGFSPFSLPLLSSIPVIGDIFFKHDALVYVSFFLPFLFWFFMNRTRWGLALGAAGENPAACFAAGLNPVKLRWAGIFFGGVLCGLGGAYLSLAYTHLWTNNMTAGRGWIAVALVIFAFWRPGRAMFGAYLFGGIMAFQLRLQAVGATLPSSLLLMLPYALTIVVLLFSSARGKGRQAPAALGVNIEPGE
ncbi:ABC transporter permease [Halodesulfovibrio sp.]|uniref:ABC transporter permease n=1 Tax=Halodesulfovibrio sp. TaxID=1912772 RepID=UPI0025CE3315|nr:ABC transporter permease [Halodesulfovibrio sp.]MCT4533973.1 ABC transporter permease [Halodesulfovibrio sp.]MCT4627202.1 ABC transporter permease [Halodesulfovibrio sp.]